VQKYKEFKTKKIVLLQAHCRGHLARVKFNRKLADKHDNQKRSIYDKFLKSVRTIQRYWRGYEVRKVYKQIKLDRAIKAMKFSYFCQQVELLNTEAYMSMIKSSYSVDQKLLSRSLNFKDLMMETSSPMNNKLNSIISSSIPNSGHVSNGLCFDLVFNF
jgi:hypothetical protein